MNAHIRFHIATVMALAALLMTSLRPFVAETRAKNLVNPIVIARTTNTLGVDGNCADYDPASALLMVDANQNKIADVFLVHNIDKLFVCVRAIPGQLYEHWIEVYLDPNGDGAAFTYAQPNDWGLRVQVVNAAPSNEVGDGQGQYLTMPLVADWQGQATSTAQSETAEFGIAVRPWQLGECGRPFGLAVFYHWGRAVGDDASVPITATYNQPSTWMTATLQHALCPAELVNKTYVPFLSR